MDEVWEAFNQVDKKYNHAYLASNEEVSVLVSYGQTESIAFKKMSELIEATDFNVILAVNGEYMDDDLYAMTVVVSHVRIG